MPSSSDRLFGDFWPCPFGVRSFHSCGLPFTRRLRSLKPRDVLSTHGPRANGPRIPVSCRMQSVADPDVAVAVFGHDSLAAGLARLFEKGDECRASITSEAATAGRARSAAGAGRCEMPCGRPPTGTKLPAVIPDVQSTAQAVFWCSIPPSNESSAMSRRRECSDNRVSAFVPDAQQPPALRSAVVPVDEGLPGLS